MLKVSLESSFGEKIVVVYKKTLFNEEDVAKFEVVAKENKLKLKDCVDAELYWRCYKLATHYCEEIGWIEKADDFEDFLDSKKKLRISPELRQKLKDIGIEKDLADLLDN